MDSFIGRTAELKVLKEAYRSPASAFIPVYGRRRVGKSQLLLHFLRGKRGLYYLGKKAPQQLQIREFLTEAARNLNQPLLSSLSVGGWKEALLAVMEQRRAGRKFILVFDEFQWIAQVSPELPSVLQELWDRSWKKRGELVLILCGSYMGFMEREILGKKSPLFGRRTAQILLKPFSYQEAAEFHPGLALEERVKIYFICGGIPYYLRFFSPEYSVPANIERQILDEFGALNREPDFLLREELRELEKYYGILLALSSGSLASKEIAQKTGIPERNVYYYLQHLTTIGYVSRRYPVTGSRPPARSVRFALDDSLLRFWFRFVYPNTSFLTQMGPRRSFQDLVRPALQGYFGGCFERLCREAVPFLYKKEGVNVAFEVGEYWDKKVEIDVVGFRRDDRIDVGECRWGTIKSLPTVWREIQDKVRRYPNKSNATVQPRLFTRVPLARQRIPEALRCHSLEDLYD